MGRVLDVLHCNITRYKKQNGHGYIRKGEALQKQNHLASWALISATAYLKAKEPIDKKSQHSVRIVKN